MTCSVNNYEILLTHLRHVNTVYHTDMYIQFVYVRKRRNFIRLNYKL